jgi:type IV secretion system protein VirD4
MPIAVILIIAALGWWIGSSLRRRRARRRTTEEINHTLQTGLPAPESAVGRKAREVAKAQAARLTNPPPVHGSARWATAADIGDLAGTWSPDAGTDGLLLGELGTGDGARELPLTAHYPGHLLTVASTGQGKSATQIVANLHTYKGSVVVVDPKGELYRLTAARRRRFSKVYRLAPFAAESEGPTDRYNPLLELGPPRERAARARQLAEMLIVRQGDKGAAEATFFENEAVNLLTLLILGTVEMAELASAPDKATLAEVRLVCSAPMLGERAERQANVTYLEDILLLYAERGRSDYVRRQARSFAHRERKQLSSFIAEINSNIAFFDGHPGFGETTAASSFAFADLASAPATVYLTIPLKETQTSFRFIRAMIGCAFGALAERDEAEHASVLFILDEFPALRDMPFMRDAVAQMRSSGAWFWFFVQDVAQLEAVYGRWANVFLSQTDHQVYFGATHDERTKQHISTGLGIMTFAHQDASLNFNYSIGMNDNETASPVQVGGTAHGRNVGQGVSINEPVVLTPRPLLTPFEVGTYLSKRQPGETHPSSTIIFSKQAGGYPIMARRRHWRELCAGTLPTSERTDHASHAASSRIGA